MRPIKFRAWNKFEKVMYDNVQDFSDDPNLPPSNFGELLGLPDEWEVMQFTGLKDRNGKEIYEEDIVEYKSGDESGVAIILASYGGANLYFEWIEQKTSSPSIVTDCNIFRYPLELLILGNSYENEELLK